MGSRDEAVKRYKKSESKRKKELKALKKQNNMLFSIANKSGSRRDIKKIRDKSSKRRRNNNSDYYSDKSKFDYSLSNNRN